MNLEMRRGFTVVELGALIAVGGRWSVIVLCAYH